MNSNLFAIHTLGCKVNLVESNKIMNDLLANGYLQVDFDNYADIYIINTCSVTGIADAKSKNYIRRAKRKNPNAITIVMGCYAQMNSEDAKELNVDIWIGNKYKNEIINLLQEFYEDKKPINRVDNLLLEKKFEENSSDLFSNKTRAFVKIQDGCNFMCSYCIIPFSRGRQRSKKKEDVIEEIRNLISNGFKEIVLTGVNTAGYFDENNCSFANLLNEISKIKGDFRVRISSIEPFQINEEIIKTITENPKRFAQQWHICLQSGSNRVLEVMNRKYTTNDFFELISKIRHKSPRSTFTTDYIVGFPTETDEDHKMSLEFLNKVKFLKIHIFPYSRRKNTAAAKLKQLNPKIQKKRFQEIYDLNEKVSIEVMEKYIGKDLEVIFENHNNQDNWQSGYTSEYINVLYETNENLQGQKITLKGIEVKWGFLIVK